MLTRTTTDSGMIQYRFNGRFHRCAGPAIICHDMSEYWWLFGKPHRYYGYPHSLYSAWWIHGVQIK
jgi:hypothetical protein